MKNPTTTEVPSIPATITIEWLQEQAKTLLSAAEAKVSAAQAVLDEAIKTLNVIRAQAGIVVEAPKEQKTRGNNSVKASHFKYVADLKAGLGGQQKAILDIIKGAGAEGISREKLVEAMIVKIPTKMKHTLLLSFYQKPLADQGCVTIS